MLAAVKSFKTAQESVPVVLDQQTKELLANYEAANIEEDFREFIEANKKAESEEIFEFLPYKVIMIPFIEMD